MENCKICIAKLLFAAFCLYPTVLFAETERRTCGPLPTPQMVDGDLESGWLHIEARHITGDHPRKGGTIFPKGTSKEALLEVSNQLAKEVNLCSAPCSSRLVFEGIGKLQRTSLRMRLVMDSKGTVTSLFPAENFPICRKLLRSPQGIASGQTEISVVEKLSEDLLALSKSLSPANVEWREYLSTTAREILSKERSGPQWYKPFGKRDDTSMVLRAVFEVPQRSLDRAINVSSLELKSDETEKSSPFSTLLLRAAAIRTWFQLKLETLGFKVKLNQLRNVDGICQRFLKSESECVIINRAFDVLNNPVSYGRSLENPTVLFEIERLAAATKSVLRELSTTKDDFESYLGPKNEVLTACARTVLHEGEGEFLSDINTNERHRYERMRVTNSGSPPYAEIFKILDKSDVSLELWIGPQELQIRCLASIGYKKIVSLNSEGNIVKAEFNGRPRILILSLEPSRLFDIHLYFELAKKQFDLTKVHLLTLSLFPSPEEWYKKFAEVWYASSIGLFLSSPVDYLIIGYGTKGGSGKSFLSSIRNMPKSCTLSAREIPGGTILTYRTRNDERKTALFIQTKTFDDLTIPISAIGSVIGEKGIPHVGIGGTAGALSDNARLGEAFVPSAIRGFSLDIDTARLNKTTDPIRNNAPEVLRASGRTFSSGPLISIMSSNLEYEGIERSLVSQGLDGIDTDSFYLFSHYLKANPLGKVFALFRISDLSLSQTDSFSKKELAAYREFWKGTSEVGNVKRRAGIDEINALFADILELKDCKGN